jgi:hypothetical protein
MHVAAKFQFERAAREFAQWLARQVILRVASASGRRILGFSGAGAEADPGGSAVRVRPRIVHRTNIQHTICVSSSERNGQYDR